MADIYKLIEVAGISPVSYAEATKDAIAEAANTLKGLTWFEVVDMGGKIEDGKVAHFQAKLKVAFKVISS